MRACDIRELKAGGVSCLIATSSTESPTWAATRRPVLGGEWRVTVAGHFAVD
jgi:hypothetical protein